MRALARSAPLLVGALLVASLFDEWATFLPAGSAESMRDELGLTYAQVAWVLVLLPAGGLLGNVFNVAADHVSRRLIASLGTLGYATCLMAFALGRQFFVLAVASFLMGACSDAMVHGTEVALTDLAGERLDRWLAQANVAGFAGDLLGPALLATTFALGWGWRPAFAITAAFVFGYGLLLAMLPLPPPTDSAESAGHAAREVLSIARDPKVLLLSMSTMLISILDEPFLAFAIAFFQIDRGQSASVATLVAGAAVAGSVTTAAVLALRAEVGSRRRRMAAGGVVLGASAVSLVLAPWIPLQALAAAGTGCGTALAWTALEARILTLRPGRAGSVMAVVATFEMPSALFPVAAGAVADAAGLAWALTMYAGVAVAFAVLSVVTNRPERARLAAP
ncbi:MAG TPA: MFS transporter [Acidimicrobiales bacterium]